VETRFNHEQFKALRGDLPIKPSRHSLIGGAPKGLQPPRDIVNRPVVSTRMPRDKTLPWQQEAPRVRSPGIPEPRLVKPPARRDDDARTDPRTPPRPPFGPLTGPQAGPERAPPPLPPRLGEVRTPPPQSSAPIPSGKAREPGPMRKPPEARPHAGPPPSAVPPKPDMREPPERPEPQARGDMRDDRKTLPGQPANKMYMKGTDRDNRKQDAQDRR
jgi:hypothetical protein